MPPSLFTYIAHIHTRTNARIYTHTLCARSPWPSTIDIISLCYCPPLMFPRVSLRAHKQSPAVLVSAPLLASSDKTSETSCADSAVEGGHARHFVLYPRILTQTEQTSTVAHSNHDFEI